MLVLALALALAQPVIAQEIVTDPDTALPEPIRTAPSLSGPWLGIGATTMTAWKGCESVTPTLALGYRFDQRFSGFPGGMSFSPGLRVNGLGCEGLGANALIDASLALGPLELGVGAYVGPAISVAPHGSGVYLHGGLGPTLALTAGPLTLVGRVGVAGGYRDQGWAEAGLELRIRAIDPDLWSPPD